MNCVCVEINNGDESKNRKSIVSVICHLCAIEGPIDPIPTQSNERGLAGT